MDTKFYLYPRDPGTIYRTNWLWVPKKYITEKWLEEHLTFSSIFADETNPIVWRLWHSTKTHWVLPRSAWTPPEEAPLVDLTPTKFGITFFGDRITLLEDQREAFETLVNNKEGVLNLAPGKGKTVLALKRVALDQVPTLVVVPELGLMAQWEDRIRTFLGYTGPIGRIQGSTHNWRHPIVLASVKTLALYTEDIPIDVRRYFGLIIFDECHRMSAATFKEALPMFWGNRIGLTATVERSDGLEGILQAHVGPPIYVDKTYNWDPTIVFVRSDTSFSLPLSQPMKVVYPRAVSKLLDDKDRNTIIINLVRKFLDVGRKVLVLTQRIKHAKLLAKLLNGVLLTGATAFQSRARILQTHRLIIATQKVASEGLDAPDLDTVIFTAPFSHFGLLEQGMGRAMRKVEGVDKHPPKIVYIWDYRIPMIKGMGQKLMRRLKENGQEFFIVPSIDLYKMG